MYIVHDRGNSNSRQSKNWGEKSLLMILNLDSIALDPHSMQYHYAKIHNIHICMRLQSAYHKMREQKLETGGS